MSRSWSYYWFLHLPHHCFSASACSKGTIKSLKWVFRFSPKCMLRVLMNYWIKRVFPTVIITIMWTVRLFGIVFVCQYYNLTAFWLPRSQVDVEYCALTERLLCCKKAKRCPKDASSFETRKLKRREMKKSRENPQNLIEKFSRYLRTDTTTYRYEDASKKIGRTVDLV